VCKLNFNAIKGGYPIRSWSNALKFPLIPALLSPLLKRGVWIDQIVHPAKEGDGQGNSVKVSLTLRDDNPKALKEQRAGYPFSSYPALDKGCTLH